MSVAQLFDFARGFTRTAIPPAIFVVLIGLLWTRVRPLTPELYRKLTGVRLAMLLAVIQCLAGMVCLMLVSTENAVGDAQGLGMLCGGYGYPFLVLYIVTLLLCRSARRGRSNAIPRRDQPG